MKDLLVQGEEHSKSVSPLRGRAVPEAGPDSRQLGEWQCGGDGGQGREWRILAIDRIALCDAHIRNALTLNCITDKADPLIPRTWQ